MPKFLVPLDLAGNELRNFVVQVLAAAPTAPATGQVYYNATDGVPYVWNGSAWLSLVTQGAVDAASMDGQPPAYYRDRANHTGTQPATSIADLDVTVLAYPLDLFAPPSAALDLDGFPISNLANPVNPQDAATKAYADSVAQGLDFKESVRAATVADITLSGTQTIDGVALTALDRVLVKNQADAAENGLYVVASGNWGRADDADTDAKVTSGLFVFTSEGTTNAATSWVLRTSDTIDLDTTNLVFSQFNGGGSVTVGSGLTQNGSVIALDVANGYGTRTARFTIGDGNATSFVVAHNLNTRDLVDAVRDTAAPYGRVYPDVAFTGLNTATITFGVAPTTNAYTVVMVG